MKKIFLILATLTAIFGVSLSAACSKSKGNESSQPSSDSGNSVPAHTCVWGREIFYDENGDGTHFQKCAVTGCEEKIIHTMGAWEFDGTEHWQLCSIADCDIDNRGEHLEKDGTCETCAQNVCVVDFMIEPNAGDETRPFKTSVILCGETIVYPSEEPTKTGYTFKGWRDKNGNTFLKAPTDTAYWRVEAVWQANTYAITYELNGGKNHNQNKDSYTYGVGMSLNVPTRGGYDFVEWQANGEKLESIPADGLGEITLTAVWSEPIFTINLGYEYAFSSGGSYVGGAITGFTDYGKTKERETLSIPAEIDGVTIEIVGANAFENCHNFRYVTFSNGVGLIDNYAFYNTRTEGLLEFYGSVISSYAFWGIGADELIYSCSIQGECAFGSCDELKKVTVTGDGDIWGEYQFRNCYNLKEVHTNNVMAIQSNAFWYCHNLETFTAKTPVQEIRDSAFRGCSALTSFDFSSVREIGEYAFEGCTKLGVIDRWSFASLETIGQNAFANCEMTYVEIPASVKEIGAYCFNGNKIEEFHFEDTENLEKIGQAAFHAERVYIPDLIEWCGIEFDYYSIESEYVYYGYYISVLDGADLYVESTLVEDLGIVYDLHSGPVNNWRNLKKINAHAFMGCASLKKITVPSSVETIGNGAFRNCENVGMVSIGSGVKTIGEGAFAFCFEIYSVDFSEATSLNTIDKYAFISNRNLQTLNVNGSSLSIEKSAFGYCTALERIIIGDSVSRIESFAFMDCFSVYTVTLGAGLTWVGAAFEECYRVAEVYNLSSLRIVSYFDSHGTNENIVKFPAPVLNLCTEAAARGNVQKTTDGFVYYTYNYSDEDDWGDYTLKETRCVLIDYKGDATDVVVPSGANISRIGNYAFYDNDQITSVTMSQTLSVGAYAFAECDNLKSVMLNGSWSSYQYKLFNGLGLFDLNGSMSSIFENCVNLETVTIGDGFEVITNGSFSGCTALKSVMVGKTVKVIDQVAFYGLENLTVYYKGTAEDWAKIYNNYVDYTYDKETTERFKLPTGITLYCYSAEEPQKNEDGTAYDGNYWRYVNGEIVVWMLTVEE